MSEIYILQAANDSNRIAEVGKAMRLPDVVGIVDEAEGGVIAYTSGRHAERIAEALDMRRALGETVREALEGDSNDAEHDALVRVADALGIHYEEV